MPYKAFNKVWLLTNHTEALIPTWQADLCKPNATCPRGFLGAIFSVTGGMEAQEEAYLAPAFALHTLAKLLWG